MGAEVFIPLERIGMAVVFSFYGWIQQVNYSITKSLYRDPIAISYSPVTPEDACPGEAVYATTSLKDQKEFFIFGKFGNQYRLKVIEDSVRLERLSSDGITSVFLDAYMLPKPGESLDFIQESVAPLDDRDVHGPQILIRRTYKFRWCGNEMKFFVHVEEIALGL